jgi:hypothetical protein
MPDLVEIVKNFANLLMIMILPFGDWNIKSRLLFFIDAPVSWSFK